MDRPGLQHLRTLPLEAVLEGFGAERDPKDPRRNWRAGSSRITVTGERFYDHQEQIGGGGAIDLTLHLLRRPVRSARAADLQAALQWLGKLEPSAPALPAPVMPHVEPPVPDRARLRRVRWYLTDRRALPAALVDAVLADGSVFADRHANVVFRLRDAQGREVGYEQRGTYERPFHAVHGSKGLYFAGRSQRSAVFVESGIEALSYLALHDPRGERGVLAVSTTGNAVELPDRVARGLRDRGLQIVVAFNADRDGDRYADRFAERLGGDVRRHRPEAKDWNEVLRQGRSVEPWTR